MGFNNIRSSVLRRDLRLRDYSPRLEGTRRVGLAGYLSLLLFGISGCVLGNRPTFVHTGYRSDQLTYYLDGAGNLGFGKETVPLGLSDGGYSGEFEHFIWTTYLGPVVDQVDVSHNRRQGRKLAAKIEHHLDQYPSGEVNIISLSAGTGIAVFALESLRPGYSVDNVIMLSSSLSADYNLNRALSHVRGSVYFFWSPDDPILRGVVPFLGTVDRSEYSSRTAGTCGAMVPWGVTSFIRDLYARKVRNIQWYPEPIVGPVKLRHAGNVRRSFIRDEVTPILVSRSRRSNPRVVTPEQQAYSTAPSQRPEQREPQSVSTFEHQGPSAPSNVLQRLVPPSASQSYSSRH